MVNMYGWIELKCNSQTQDSRTQQPSNTLEIKTQDEKTLRFESSSKLNNAINVNFFLENFIDAHIIQALRVTSSFLLLRMCSINDK